MGKNVPRQIKRLEALYDEACNVYLQSSLSKSIATALDPRRRPHIDKLVLLGLGSLGVSKDQPRRIKQLVLFIAAASFIASTSRPDSAVALYAQDPMFTKTDEAFLQHLGFTILRTPSPYQLGEAGGIIDERTLVYTPHLTLAAYKALLTSSMKALGHVSLEDRMPVLMSDDFDVLRRKWDKHTEEFKDVELLTRRLKGYSYRRRAVGGGGFWTEDDSSFPVALYSKTSPRGAGGHDASGQGHQWKKHTS